MSKKRFLILAAVAGALSISTGTGAAEIRDPCAAHGGCFDGDWTPIKVQRHHVRRHVERRPAPKRK